MNIKLHKSALKNNCSITITGSKSESNRLLLLQALYPEICVDNISNSDDSKVMQNALQTESGVIDVHHAGTAMRFLTAYFAIQKGRDILLTGSSRMQERPIKVLVDALNQLGADISYSKKEGCPPIKIKGEELVEHKVTLKANVSSQYISALLLIAPKLKNGLQLTLDGDITSIPYIEMTLSLLNQIGVDTQFKDNIIVVKPFADKLEPKTIVVESDWSSASYFFSIIALSEVGTQITLTAYKQDSLQGDSALVKIYKNFGVETVYKDNAITIKKVDNSQPTTINFDLKDSPDIAQTIAVTCFGMGIACNLKGLHTLKIKETDRLEALKNELEKLGAKVEVTNDSLYLHTSKKINENISIATYNDHRMAMAFAPLALKMTLQIEDANVVSKSYPTFWNNLEALDFEISR
ncbi:3-phosphoshikimate 1-carboxyvinyltransferase [Ichthyenterobacterium magnum]|uniref:3-phosphoshikimate 1-carboxyvinyltransferase n=1 Tax=Ichthyenterobacterium magnum TaxID=1230530 RepID=A0A420DFG5_9FLAO|nr:3-phosphoshikimate 1-carboxyvinyltransferase [Ichthyenterobacterium magnum]RKE91957.1 3-phosphoshikimate 1-carboxyvinyltransferase [Ichthyenterobacterium magnum]